MATGIAECVSLLRFQLFEQLLELRQVAKRREVLILPHLLGVAVAGGDGPFERFEGQLDIIVARQLHFGREFAGLLGREKDSAAGRRVEATIWSLPLVRTLFRHSRPRLCDEFSCCCY